MNILVTGGAGYLGVVLVEALLRGAGSVTVLDTFRHGVPSLLHLTHHPHLAVVRGDARDVAVLHPLVARTDAVVALAAVVGAAACDIEPHTAYNTNLDAIVALCDLLSPEQILVYPCTNSGYGVSGNALCTEDSPLLPLTLYGRTKVAAEHVALQHPRAVSLRFATLFGVSARMRLDLLVNDFVFRAVHDRALVLFEGGFRRNYLHVRDAARSIVWGLEGSLLYQQPYNVGLSAANLTKRELCSAIQYQIPEFTWTEAATGSDPDRRDYLVSNARIEATGWKPQFSLIDGITELMRAYQQPLQLNWRNA